MYEEAEEAGDSTSPKFSFYLFWCNLFMSDTQKYLHLKYNYGFAHDREEGYG
jgi:hypothetical protein